MALRSCIYYNKLSKYFHHFLFLSKTKIFLLSFTVAKTTGRGCRISQAVDLAKVCFWVLGLCLNQTGSWVLRCVIDCGFDQFLFTFREFNSKFQYVFLAFEVIKSSKLRSNHQLSNP